MVLALLSKPLIHWYHRHSWYIQANNIFIQWYKTIDKFRSLDAPEKKSK